MSDSDYASSSEPEVEDKTKQLSDAESVEDPPKEVDGLDSDLDADEKEEDDVDDEVAGLDDDEKEEMVFLASSTGKTWTVSMEVLQMSEFFVSAFDSGNETTSDDPLVLPTGSDKFLDFMFTYMNANVKDEPDAPEKPLKTRNGKRINIREILGAEAGLFEFFIPEDRALRYRRACSAALDVIAYNPGNLQVKIFAIIASALQGQDVETIRAMAAAAENYDISTEEKDD
jgi:hypothetical protein